MKLSKTITLMCLFLFSIFMIHSQDINGDDLEVRLLIIGQGDPVYSLWGHTGIAIKNTITDKDIFFDFGNFNFEDEQFFKNFAVGRLLYIAWAAYLEPYIQSVFHDKRDLTEYVLDLSPQKKLELYNALRTKALPENRTYLYHHYKDNCSTRIRDYINDAVYGQLQEKTEVSRGSTFRRSFLLFTSNKKIIGSILSILQGPEIDKEITIWQEMFLPEILKQEIENFQYINEKDENVTLVKRKNILYSTDQRIPLPEKYTPPYSQVILISLFFSAIVLFLNFRSLKGNRRIWAISNILTSFFLGILGSALLFLAAFTDHSYSYNNLNLFMINPVALFIIPVAILYWRKGETWRKKLHILWSLQLIFTLIMILIKILTPVKQDNLLEIILFLPILISYTPLIPRILQKKELIEAVL